MAEYNFSFDNKTHSSFDSSTFSILDEFIDGQDLNKTFNIIPYSKVDFWHTAVSKQLTQLVEKYETPDPSFDPKFEKRNTILYSNKALELSHTDPTHNNILLLYGFLSQIENCLKNKENFYIVSFTRILTQEQRTVLSMMKYLLRNNEATQVDEALNAIKQRFTEISNIRPNFDIPSDVNIKDNLNVIIKAMVDEEMIRVNQNGAIEKKSNLDKFVL